MALNNLNRVTMGYGFGYTLFTFNSIGLRKQTDIVKLPEIRMRGTQT